MDGRRSTPRPAGVRYWTPNGKQEHRYGFVKTSLLFCLPLLSFQMHVAELLVSHGASLNAKTFLDETPIGVFGTDLSLDPHWG